MPIYGVEAYAPGNAPPIIPPSPPAASVTFMAVGTDWTGPLLMTTEDAGAEHWLDRSSSIAVLRANAYLEDCCYSPELDRWVVVGHDDDYTTPRVFYSDDHGGTWTEAIADPHADFQINGVCWTGNVFIAVGFGSSPSYPTARVMVSPDGVHWTAKTSAVTNTEWYRVTGIAGLAVACGSADPIFFNSPATLMVSLDEGETWTQRAVSGLNAASQAALTVVSGGIHVVAGASSSGQPSSGSCVNTSANNGTSWTNRNTPGDQLYYGCAWNGSIFVVVGCDYNTNTEGRAASSTDGINWTARDTDPHNVGGFNGPNWFDVAALMGGGFCAVGHDNNAWTIPYITYSADGLTWAARTPDPATNCALFGVGAGILVS